MDWDTIKEDMIALANKNIELCTEYYSCRKKYAKAKYEIDIILASKLPDLRVKRPNVGYEMGLMMILDSSPNISEIRGIYEALISSENDFKGLERIIEANQAKLSLYQSVLKYLKEV